MIYILIIVFCLIAFICLRKQGAYTGTHPKKTTVRTIPVGPALCPYCQKSFEERPKRNRKCPACGSKIILRRGVLLTESQAEDHDKKRSAQIGASIAASKKASLERYRKDGVKCVQILATGQTSCKACRALRGKKFLVKDELRNPTLPVKDCTGYYGHCRCAYIPVVR